MFQLNSYITVLQSYFSKTETIKILFISLILIGIFLIFLLIKYIFVKFGKIIFKLSFKLFNIIIQKILSNIYVKSFIKSHPKILLFIGNRFKKYDFLGLPLTILSFLILYLSIEYIGLTDSISDGKIITQIDVRLSEFFYYFKDIRLINLFLLINYFGEFVTILLATIIFSAILFVKGKRIEIIGLLSSIGIINIISYISNLIIKRQSPELAIYKDLNYHFPSFQASLPIVLYGFIIWLFLIKIKKLKKRVNIIFTGIILIFLIGLSRLYLNVNYLSDVISGWFLGFLGLIFGITIILYLKYKFQNKNNIYLFKYNKIITYFLILLGVIFLTLNYNDYYNNIIFTKEIKSKYIQITNIKDFFNKNPKLKFTETITGRQTEPINFIFVVKNQNDLINIFNKSGWTEADKLGRTSIKKMLGATFDKTTYLNSPITPLYWNKEIQTLGFQQLTKDENIKFRHHIRIWKTNYKVGDEFIYVGCGIYDDGLKWGVIHKIDGNIDKERDFTFKDLEKSNLILNYKLVNLTGKISGTNSYGDKFFTDGNTYEVEVK
ncbi:MAG: LssY C-terminal domain-containing protein [Candidatus Gracilibacteria bacterium]|nr:LssY C-terminal domain-containing protein [Candidatus Gracilibacteria bacterium]